MHERVKQSNLERDGGRGRGGGRGERGEEREKDKEGERLLSQAATATKPKGDYNNCNSCQTNQCHVEDTPFCIAIKNVTMSCDLVM